MIDKDDLEFVKSFNGTQFFADLNKELREFLGGCFDVIEKDLVDSNIIEPSEIIKGLKKFKQKSTGRMAHQLAKLEINTKERLFLSSEELMQLEVRGTGLRKPSPEKKDQAEEASKKQMNQFLRAFKLEAQAIVDKRHQKLVEIMGKLPGKEEKAKEEKRLLEIANRVSKLNIN